MWFLTSRLRGLLVVDILGRISKVPIPSIRITELLKRPPILKCQVSLCWFGLDWFVLPKTTSASGSGDHFVLTKVLIKITSTCCKSSSLTWYEGLRTMWRPYNDARKAGEISVFFYKRSWDPAALTGLLEILKAVSCDCRDHAMTRTAPTGPCCLSHIYHCESLSF